jgi:hypothetical protein
MMRLAGTGHRAGVVRINGRSVWALSVFEYFGDNAASARGKRLRVRINLDDCEHLGLCDYRQVHLKLGRLAERVLYLRARRDAPPFCWLEFGTLLGW